jgi:hypothetical protein
MVEQVAWRRFRPIIKPMKRTNLAIALAVGLVALTATSFWLGSRSVNRGPEMVTVIVSNRDIGENVNLNRLIQDGAFRPVQVPSNLVVSGVITEIDQLKDKTTSVPIYANEQIPIVRVSGYCAFAPCL